MVCSQTVHKLLMLHREWLDREGLDREGLDTEGMHNEFCT